MSYEYSHHQKTTRNLWYLMLCVGVMRRQRWALMGISFHDTFVKSNDLVMISEHYNIINI